MIFDRGTAYQLDDDDRRVIESTSNRPDPDGHLRAIHERLISSNVGAHRRLLDELRATERAILMREACVELLTAATEAQS